MSQRVFQSAYHREFAPEEIDLIIHFGTDNLHQNQQMRHGEYLKSLTEQDIKDLADPKKKLPDIDPVWLLNEMTLGLMSISEQAYGNFDAPARYYDWEAREWKEASDPPFTPDEPQYTRLSDNRIDELGIAFPSFAEWYRSSHDDYGTYVGRDILAAMQEKAKSA